MQNPDAGLLCLGDLDLSRAQRPRPDQFALPRFAIVGGGQGQLPTRHGRPRKRREPGVPLHTNIHSAGGTHIAAHRGRGYWTVWRRSGKIAEGILLGTTLEGARAELEKVKALFP